MPRNVGRSLGPRRSANSATNGLRWPPLGTCSPSRGQSSSEDTQSWPSRGSLGKSSTGRTRSDPRFARTFLTHKQVHEARQIRDAEAADPGAGARLSLAASHRDSDLAFLTSVCRGITKGLSTL